MAWAKRLRGQALSETERAEWIVLFHEEPNAGDSGFCATPAVAILEAMVETQIRRRRWQPHVREAVQRTVWDGDERYPWCAWRDGLFVIEYQREGCFAVAGDCDAFTIAEPGDPAHTPVHALPAGDVPNYVRRLRFWLERAFAIYADDFGMPLPVVPLTVRLSGYWRLGVVPTGFYTSVGLGIHHAAHPDLLCSLAVHELFHAFQGRYPGPRSWMSLCEGGATAMEDLVATRVNRYLYEAGDGYDGPGVLSEPSQSIASVRTGGYKASLFWRYLIEQCSPDRAQPLRGAAAYRHVLDVCGHGGDIESAVRTTFPHRSLARFAWTDSSCTELAVTETVLGNYLVACRLQEPGVHTDDDRFTLAERRDVIQCSNLYPPDAPHIATIPSVKRACLDVGPNERRRHEFSLDRFGQEFVDVRIGEGVEAVAVEYDGAARAALVQVVLLDGGARVIDIIRAIGSLRRSITTARSDGIRVAMCAMAFSGADSRGACVLEVSAVAPGPDVMITRWNCAPGTEYEIDPRSSPWTWTSPDMRWVKGRRADAVSVRLHNRSVPVDDVGIQLHHQRFTRSDGIPALDAAAWRQGPSIRVSVPPGQSWYDLAWPSGHDAGYLRCLRAIVSVPGDHHRDNKRALSLVDP